MKVRKYDSKSITSYAFPENLRRFPSMYIGSTDSHGLFLILRELLDNAVDEYLADRATAVQVYFDEGSYWVHDNGTGIPQGIKKLKVMVHGKEVVSKMPTMQAIFGTLHTSGKHGEAYGVSRGVHGCGSKATNALSLSFKVWTKYQGDWYHIAFAKGKLTTDGVVRAKPPKNQPFDKIVKGSLIYFEPDTSIFTAKKFAGSLISEWSKITSYLSPKFKITLISSKNPKKPIVYYSENGPRDYINERIDELKVKPIKAKLYFEAHNELVDTVVAFTDYDGCDLKGYTNGLANAEGGTHVNGVQNGMMRALKPFAKKKHKFTAHEFKDGLLGIVNAKLSGAKFSSQEKIKLADPRFDKDFEDWIYKQATIFFKKNPKLANELC